LPLDRPAPSSVEPPASSIEPSQPQPDAETSAAEVQLTGTDGARILPFVPVAGAQTSVLVDTGSKQPVAPGTTIPATIDLFDLGSLKRSLVWRPVKFTRNRDYPKVVAEGCHFKRDSAGFALRRKKPFKYLGYYRREVIRNLEKEYGSKKPRKRKD